MDSKSIWDYSGDGDWPSADVVGFKVEASDGHIGKVDEVHVEAGSGFIVVDTGPWIFGKHVMLPAGLITRVDLAEEEVHVSRTKDEIGDSPPFNTGGHKEPRYRDSLGAYYGPRVF